MNEETGQQLRLQRVGDALLEKAEAFVRQLEPEQMSPQSLKQLSGFLKDLRELGKEKEEPRQEITVRFQNAETDWKR